jgi:hypothetical protein
MSNRREKILLGLFLVALLVVVLIFGGSFVNRSLREKNSALRQREAHLAELQIWLQSGEAIQTREKWIATAPPPAYVPQQSEAAFVHDIQASLSGTGIETVEQKLQESHPAGTFVEVPYDLILNCSLEQLVKWLYAYQKPGAYRVISQIRLKSDQNAEKVHAEVSVVQLFEKPSS